MNSSPLGIIAGSGELPLQLIETCRAQHRPFFVLTFEENDTNHFVNVPHARVRLGAIGEAIRYLQSAGVKELVLAGGIRRPSFSSLKPDAMGAKLMARLGTKLFAGDDALLKVVIKFLEEEGFKVLGSDDLLKDLLAPAGILGKHAPDAQAMEDIALGFKVAKTLGAFDIGQAVVVEHGLALGVEGAEGTDALVARCGALKRNARGGVLVKAKKPQQERRVDLPSIGVHTVERVHSVGLSGIALESGSSLILGREQVISVANDLGIFLVGTQND